MKLKLYLLLRPVKKEGGGGGGRRSGLWLGASLSAMRKKTPQSTVTTTAKIIIMKTGKKTQTRHNVAPIPFYFFLFVFAACVGSPHLCRGVVCLAHIPLTRRPVPSSLFFADDQWLRRSSATEREREFKKKRKHEMMSFWAACRQLPVSVAVAVASLPKNA